MFNDNITIFGNIMVTENYDMFKKIGGNRKINKANYSKIVKSMKVTKLCKDYTTSFYVNQWCNH